MSRYEVMTYGWQKVWIFCKLMSKYGVLLYGCQGMEFWYMDVKVCSLGTWMLMYGVLVMDGKVCSLGTYMSKY